MRFELIKTYERDGTYGDEIGNRLRRIEKRLAEAIDREMAKDEMALRDKEMKDYISSTTEVPWS